MTVDEIEAYAITPFTNIKNNCATVLDVSIDAVQTSIQVVAGSGAIFPAAPFYCSCEYEVMVCSGRSGDTLTVTRGQDGTTAAAHVAGTIIEQRNNAALWTDLASSINKIENGTTVIPVNAPDGSITNAKLASDVYRPNILQNGGFEANFSPGPFTTHNIPFADSWLAFINGGANYSLTRDIVNKDSGVCCVSFVAGVGTGQAPNNTGFSQSLANLIPSLSGRTITYSARIRTSVVNAVRLCWSEGGGNLFYSSYHTGNGAYQTLSLTRTIAAGIPNIQVYVFVEAPATVYIDSMSVALGTIAVDYQPTISYPDAIPNSRLAPDVGRINYLINPGFEIWQRGTNFNGVYAAVISCADRWGFTLGTNGGSMSVAKGTNADTGIYSAQIIVGAGSSGDIRQYIKDVQLLNELKRKTISASMRVWSTIPNSVRAQISGTGSGGQSLSTYHTGSGWETLYCTSYIVPDTSTDILFSASMVVGGTYVFDSAMVVIGSVAADYVSPHPVDDISRCNRYYQRWNSVSGRPLASGVALGTNRVFVVMSTKGQHYATPSLTVSAWSDFNINAGTSAPTCSSVGAVYGGDVQYGMDITTATAPFGLPSPALLCNANSTGYLILESAP